MLFRSVNDLPLESYCEQIAHDMDIIASFEKRDHADCLMGSSNMPLYPISSASAPIWMGRSEEKLREAIRKKPVATFQWKKWRGKEPPKENTNGDHNV